MAVRCVEAEPSSMFDWEISLLSDPERVCVKITSKRLLASQCEFLMKRRAFIGEFNWGDFPPFDALEFIKFLEDEIKTKSDNVAVCFAAPKLDAQLHIHAKFYGSVDVAFDLELSETQCSWDAQSDLVH